MAQNGLSHAQLRPQNSTVESYGEKHWFVLRIGEIAASVSTVVLNRLWLLNSCKRIDIFATLIV